MERTLTTILMVLLTMHLIHVTHMAASRIDKVRDGHPTDFLVSSDADGTGQWEHQAAGRDENAQVDAMTQDLLERLAAANGADATRPSVRYILDLFEKLERGEDMQEATGIQGKASDSITDADVIKGIAPTVSKKRRTKADVALSFPLSGLTGSDQTELAELRIRPLTRHPANRSGDRRPVRRPARRGGFQRVRVSILDKDGDRQVERIYRVRWRLDQRDDFDVLDVTKILRDMVARGTQQFQNGSLEISLRKTRRHRGGSKTGERRQVRSSGNSPDEHNQLENDAMMVVYSKSTPATLMDKDIRSLQRSPLKTAAKPEARTPHHRARRGARKHRKSRCAHKDMFVSFETLGWADDIIFPIRYNARTCSGKCPSPVDRSLHPTNHAIIKSMMRLHDRSVKRPCCVPATLKPLMMLYKLAAGNIEIRYHPDMVVDECGCR